jgi:chemotaxis protein MotB
MRQCLSCKGQGWIPALLISLAALAGGCQDGLKAERDALRNENEELRNQLQSSRQALEEAEAARARLTERVAELEQQNEQNQENNAFRNIEGVESSAGRGRVMVRVPGDVLFAPGKIQVKSSAKKTLNEIADVLDSEYAGKAIRVEGYTDSDPIDKSDWDDNLQLSAERAMAVERYLENQGISGDRMYSAGFGSAKPRDTKKKSRRVEIVVVMQPEGE